MLERTCFRRPGAIAALATIALLAPPALAGAATPALAGGDDGSSACTAGACGPAPRGGGRAGADDLLGDVITGLAGALVDRHGRARVDCDDGRRRQRLERSWRRAAGRRGHAVIEGRCHEWVRGRWVVHAERVCVRPATTRRVWVPPVWTTRHDACGRPYRVRVRAGGWKTVTVPARYETRHVRTWREGRWRPCDEGCGQRHRGGHRRTGVHRGRLG